jgi:hypothetical protein
VKIEIPAHISTGGAIDRMGNKAEVFICPVVSLIIILYAFGIFNG